MSSTCACTPKYETVISFTRPALSLVQVWPLLYCATLAMVQPPPEGVLVSVPEVFEVFCPQ